MDEIVIFDTERRIVQIIDGLDVYGEYGIACPTWSDDEEFIYVGLNAYATDSRHILIYSVDGGCLLEDISLPSDVSSILSPIPASGHSYIAFSPYTIDSGLQIAVMYPSREIQYFSFPFYQAQFPI
jgi:hypothetical protein